VSPDETRYELLRPDAVEQRRAAAPVAYVPWGALEWHGPHLPIGVDGLTAQGVCLGAAARTGGVVLPAVWLGTGTLEVPLGSAHCVEIGADLVRELAGQVVRQLRADDWKHVVVVAGHYGDDQMAALRAGAGADATVVAIWELAPDVVPRDHAAVGETAMTMAVAPSLVYVDALPDGGELSTAKDGVWGEDPRGVTAEHASVLHAAAVSGLADLVARLLA